MNYFFSLLLLLAAVLPASAQQQQEPVQLSALILPDAAGGSFSTTHIKDHRATVFIFMSETCPITQKYSPELRKLSEKYSGLGIPFYGVFPDEELIADSVQSFARRYKLKFPMLLDTKYKLTRLLKAKIAPQALVVDAGGETLYSGAIDNWFYALGKHRTVVTRHYLQDALDAVLAGKRVEPGVTEAIGCVLPSFEEKEK